MLVFLIMSFFPLHERQFELADAPYSMMSFTDGGSAELARIIGPGYTAVLAPDCPRCGYALYVANTHPQNVQLTVFNWHLLAYEREADRQGKDIGLLAYAGGAIPSMADGLEWALSVYDAYGLPRPTTRWEPGFPPHSKSWETWISHIRSQPRQGYDPQAEREAERDIKAILGQTR